MENKEFFIGWQEKLPLSSKKVIKKYLLITFLIIPIFALIVVLNQQYFRGHVFNLGKITEVEGIYVSNPLPMLLVDDKNWDQSLSREILLVGYGKSGAEGVIENSIEGSASIDGHRLRLQGTLIHGDGKTVMELTKKDKSVVEVLENTTTQLNQSDKITKELNGEIIDPKCYFGVMKPGEGKVHKSCAIRCISGGIPPVLKVENEAENIYYLILGNEGQKINKELLRFVAEPVRINGKTYKINGWNIIEINSSDIVIL